MYFEKLTLNTIKSEIHLSMWPKKLYIPYTSTYIVKANSLIMLSIIAENITNNTSFFDFVYLYI